MIEYLNWKSSLMSSSPSSIPPIFMADLREALWTELCWELLELLKLVVAFTFSILRLGPLVLLSKQMANNILKTTILGITKETLHKRQKGKKKHVWRPAFLKNVKICFLFLFEMAACHICLWQLTKLFKKSRHILCVFAIVTWSTCTWNGSVCM